jgi:HK97 gp10 family phage protein
MLKSIKTTKTSRLKNNDGYSITVRPTGKDKRGVRNMEKMVYMEYGTSKQSATPVLTPAIRESRESVEKKMQEVFDREVGD